MFSPPKFPINADGKRKVGMGWGGGGGGGGRRKETSVAEMDLASKSGNQMSVEEEARGGGIQSGG